MSDCTLCGIYQTKNNSCKDKSRSSGFSSRCKVCNKEYMENYMFHKKGINKTVGYFLMCEQCGKVLKLFMKDIVNKSTPLCQKCYRENYEPWNKGMRTAKPETEKDYKEPRWSSEYRDWHNECLRRDWYHCQLCESKERLEVHHIKSYKDYPQERLNLNNGITLCKKCHLEVHNFSVLDQQ